MPQLAAREMRESRSTTRRVLRVLAWTAGAIVGLLALALLVASLVYPVEYVRRIVFWGESDVDDYVHNFPQRPLAAAAEPFRFAAAPDEARVRAALEPILGVEDLESFFEESRTQAFLVIQDDTILYERYFNGAQRDSMLTSYSVAKSFDSALVGIAIDEGLLPGVDVPITDYLPELVDRDARFAEITIRDLLMMASGLLYEDDRLLLFNGDGPLTTYHPDQRALALGTLEIRDPPGEYFLYNKYHPQLVGMILERATGMSVTEFTQRSLWDPLGMEFDGAWCLDSEEDGFEKMESGLNARAIDFAKLGRLFLQGGAWDGGRVVSSAWVDESTSRDPATDRSDYYPDEFGQQIYDSGRGWYKYWWYGAARDDGTYDFAAMGDHGQYIYVSPASRLVIVRNGLEFGIESHDWFSAFYAMAGLL